MKKILIYTMVVGILTACTKDFEGMNTDPNKITAVSEREMPFMFAKAQSAAAMDRSFYQTVQNLGADLYAQYYASSVTSFQADRYVLTPDWQRRFWTVVYVNTAPQLKSILDNKEPTSGEFALASIWWVYTFHRLTDHFGPVPYFQAVEPIDAIPYDSQEAIYEDFFKRLDEAVVNLTAMGNNATVFKGYDLIYDGNVANWIKFANTLRLRLALRISAVNPAKAKEEAEKAYTAGVFTANVDNANLMKVLEGNDSNGLAQVAAWNEFAMSSTMASYLKGYADPRLEQYFQPDVTNNKYSSLRNGLPPSALNNPRNTSAQNSNVGNSWVTWNPDAKSWTPNLVREQPIMNAAEAYFLRAEGALNGWDMGGDAQELYKQGVATSLQQWGAENGTANAYVESEAVPIAPEDANNSPAVSTTPIKWSTDVNVQRMQIATQKWLAIFPDGMEAWAEYRRTNYPVLYPLVQSDNTDLPVGTFINRLPYPLTEETSNATELQKGRALLGGADNAATKVWWDVD
jgi:hypothetical protein